MADIHDASGIPPLSTRLDDIQPIWPPTFAEELANRFGAHNTRLGGLEEKTAKLTEIVGKEQSKLQDLALQVEANTGDMQREQQVLATVVDALEVVTNKVENLVEIVHHEQNRTKDAFLEVGQAIENSIQTTGTILENLNHRLKQNEEDDLEKVQALTGMIEATRSDTNRALRSVWVMAIALGIIASLQGFALVALYLIR